MMTRLSSPRVKKRKRQRRGQRLHRLGRNLNAVRRRQQQKRRQRRSLSLACSRQEPHQELSEIWFQKKWCHPSQLALLPQGLTTARWGVGSAQQCRHPRRWLRRHKQRVRHLYLLQRSRLRR
jgi:hypothetical protein